MSKNALGRTLSPDWRLENAFSAPAPRMAAPRSTKPNWAVGQTLIPEDAMEVAEALAEQPSPWMTLDEAGKEFFDLLGDAAPAEDVAWEESASLEPAPDGGEVDAWMRRKARRFWATSAALLVATGALAALFAFSPVMTSADAPTVAEAVAAAEAATPTPPERVMVHVPIERGDTFTGLMAEHGLDGVALYRTAQPLYDLSRIQPGSEIVIHKVVGEDLPRQVKYAVDGRTLVIERVAWDWTAYWAG